MKKTVRTTTVAIAVAGGLMMAAPVVAQQTGPGLTFFATLESSSARTAPSVGGQSFAQADKPVAAPRRSIQTHFEAVKKRLSQDRQKFRECSLKLDDAKKKQRMRTWKQIDFLEDCMQDKL
jgi:hypothetical protein